jgi:hypothetical protein
MPASIEPAFTENAALWLQAKIRGVRVSGIIYDDGEVESQPGNHV